MIGLAIIAPQYNPPGLAPEAGEIPGTRADCEAEERDENLSELGTAIAADVGEPAKTENTPKIMRDASHNGRLSIH